MAAIAGALDRGVATLPLWRRDSGAGGTAQRHRLPGPRANDHHDIS